MKSLNKKQFGDFQTPFELAEKVLLIIEKFFTASPPDLIIEPSCGKGVFVLASKSKFENVKVFASDINKDYIREAKIMNKNYSDISFSVENFFFKDWKSIVSTDEHHVFLIIGNPPWVTSSELGYLDRFNLPSKTNFQKRIGMDALLGKSNFDISEYMILQYMKWIEQKKGVIAVLCKYSVARKIFKQQSKKNWKFSIYLFDSRKYFNISVKACLLIVENITNLNSISDCPVYNELDSENSLHSIGIRNGILLSNIYEFESRKNLLSYNKEKNFQWRSGIKHDCSKVMELSIEDGLLINGFKEKLNIEEEIVFPLLKGSHIANGRVHEPTKFVIATQRFVGQDTGYIEHLAPKTWHYLQKYSKYLDGRKSSIYRSKPRFSIFGIGEYTFKPWKIAVSSMYKQITFQLVSPYKGKPFLFDDTVNFLSFQYYESAIFIYRLLNHDSAKEFFHSMVFMDDKRPITIEILQRLSLKNLAQSLNKSESYRKVLRSELKDNTY